MEVSRVLVNIYLHSGIYLGKLENKLNVEMLYGSGRRFKKSKSCLVIDLSSLRKFYGMFCLTITNIISQTINDCSYSKIIVMNYYHYVYHQRNTMLKSLLMN